MLAHRAARRSGRTAREYLEGCDSADISEAIAFDRIEPPDFWESTTVRLLYALLCSWSKSPPPLKAFLPHARPAQMTDDEIRSRLSAIRPG